MKNDIRAGEEVWVKAVVGHTAQGYADIRVVSGEPNEGSVQSVPLDQLRAHNSDSADPVAVKPLEWVEEIGGTWWTADAYRIEAFDGGGYAARVSHPQSRAFRTIGVFKEIHDAKSAAQADYETRIRSALASPPAKEVIDDMIERVARALATERYEDRNAFDDLRDGESQVFMTKNDFRRLAKVALDGNGEYALTNRTPDDEAGNG